MEDQEDIGSDDDTTLIDSNIPKKVKDEFKCDDIVCTKEINNLKIDYMIEDKTFYIKDVDIRIQYDINSNIFDYSSSKISFTIENDKLTCNSEQCKNYKELYDKYFNNLIKNYIN